MIDHTALCIEFTHTKGWAARDRSDDELVDYRALVAWAEAQGALDPRRAAALRRAAAANPDAASRALGRAVELRALLYRILTAVGRGAASDDSDLSALNRWLREANRQVELVRTESGYAWGWREADGGAGDRLDRAVWPVVRSAAALLTSTEPDRLKLCEADDCGWLFIDASRNRSRRWCDMSDCGNRAKARRHRERQRSRKPTRSPA